MKFVLVIAPPRSGSSWFSSLLNSHPDVVYRHEALGRCEKLREKGYLEHLKHDFGLSAKDRQGLIDILLRPDPATLRPPFFTKSYQRISPCLLYPLWLGAEKNCWLKRLFEISATLNPSDRTVMVVKETGWSAHLESIIAGLVPDHVIFLMRHPCAIISSILDGISLGLMKKQSVAQRKKWMDAHVQTGYMPTSYLNEEKLFEMTNLEFWACKIKLMYEIFVKLQDKLKGKSSFVIYEDVCSSTDEELRKIFKRLPLAYSEEVKKFVVESKGKSKKALFPDSRSPYFSVHRDKSFDPYKWQKKLASKDVDAINTIIGKDFIDIYWKGR